jgi:hypothetical protein
MIGNYTPKYWKTKELIERFNTERNAPKLKQYLPPKHNRAVSYGVIEMTEQLCLYHILSNIKSYSSKSPVSMENINIEPNYGQNFGFTLYRTSIPVSKVITFSKGMNN